MPACVWVCSAHALGANAGTPQEHHQMHTAQRSQSRTLPRWPSHPILPSFLSSISAYSTLRATIFQISGRASSWNILRFGDTKQNTGLARKSVGTWYVRNETNETNQEKIPPVKTFPFLRAKLPRGGRDPPPPTAPPLRCVHRYRTW